jgi:hypothetical protein
MSENPPGPAMPTSKQVALLLTIIALVSFGAGWAFDAANGGGYHARLMAGIGAMIGALSASIVCVASGWSISGRAEPFALLLALMGGMAGGSHAARQGAWVVSFIGILIESVLLGTGFGLMAHRSRKAPPSVTREV